MSEPVVTVLTAIVGVAIIAVLVSNKSNTANVLGSLGGAFSNALSAAVSPVTGNSAAPNVNAGLSNNGFFVGSSGNLTGGMPNIGLSLFG